MMSTLSQQERLRLLLTEQQERLQQTIPLAGGRAVLALTRASDERFLQTQDLLPAVSAGTPLTVATLFASGWLKAFQCCYGPVDAAASGSSFDPERSLDAWADHILQECDRLSAGEQVLAHCETGFLRIPATGGEDFSVWIGSPQMPTEWREREDLLWWARAQTRTYAAELRELALEKASLQPQIDAFAREWQADAPVYRTTPAIDDCYRRLGQLRVQCLACHLPYPGQTLFGGCAVELYGSVLAVLIGWAGAHLDLCRAYVAQHPSCPLRALLAPPQTEAFLVAKLSEALGADRAALGRVVEAYCLGPENVSQHCAAAGAPAPPLLRLDEERLVWSLTGLLGEPFLFLTRELKRRHALEYHAAAHLREAAFRQDLYRLFSGSRYVRSAGRVELRGVQGDLTTDVDAVIFDRKTGAMALFELKSQDPFASSRQERIRQRDYFHQAGKQVLACVQWLNRNGANTLLARLDPRGVKRLKVQQTYLFVLGRYLAHFFDGPAFDRRAAWGTWPQVLRVVQGGTIGAEDAHPIQSLHHRLLKESPLIPSSPPPGVQEIPIGACNLYVFPDFQAYRDRAGGAAD
jgi:hypothetical protein